MPLFGGNRESHYSTLRNNTANWWFKDHGLRLAALTFVVGSAGSINSGYDGSLMNGLLANKRFIEAIDNPDGSKLGIISAAYSLGGLFGVFLAPIFADKYGRRLNILIGAMFIICGAFVQAFTTGGNKMLGGRVIVGFGSIFQVTGGAPLVAETAHPRNRVQCTALINTSWYIGSIIAAWTTYGALNIVGSWSWRLCCLVQAAPCVLQLIGLYFAEESPRWMISKGQNERALHVLAKLHANGDIDDELVQFEFEEIKEAIAAEKEAKAGTKLSSFLKTKGNRHRLFIIVTVSIFSQWVGNGIISYYLAKILKSVGVTDSKSQAGYNGGLQIFNWFAAIGGALAAERLGRRFLWLTSSCGMLASFIVITACSAIYAEKHIIASGRAVMAFLFVYFGFYDIAFTALVVAYPIEILPYALRVKGVAIGQFTVSAALFFNQYVNPIALDAIAWKYYFMYIGIISIAIVTIYFTYPETKGRMLEEVGEIFDGERAVPPVARELDDGEFQKNNDTQQIEDSKV